MIMWPEALVFFVANFGPAEWMDHIDELPTATGLDRFQVLARDFSQQLERISNFKILLI